LRIMDLSSNEFSGNLPASLFENFQAMKIIDENMKNPRYVGVGPVTITTKGLDLVLVRFWSNNMIIDLSGNRFEGYIPRIIGDLIGLCTLNLSHKVLEGHIPESLQHLSNSYQGNDGLRGFPLSKSCGGDDGVPQATTPFELDQEGGGDSSMISWQAVLMGYGCGLIIGLSDQEAIDPYLPEKDEELIHLQILPYLQAGGNDESLIVLNANFLTLLNYMSHF
ncbi:hypothetical protein HAX54_045173, partial [Datura stramonium]|nr:hypothetical protein [Datura stramonium]